MSLRVTGSEECFDWFKCLRELIACIEQNQTNSLPAKRRICWRFLLAQKFSLCITRTKNRFLATIKIIQCCFIGKNTHQLHLNTLTMTIHVEQEALLRVLESPLPHANPQPNHLQSHSPSSQGDEYVLVDFRNTFKSNDCAVEKLRYSTYDDEDSVLTFSTASLSDSDSEVERSVSFADDVVTEEWTRPYTPKEEVSKLFYSTEETQR